MTSYTSGRCSVYLTGSQSQSIDVSVPYNCLQWYVMDPDVKSTPQSGYGMFCRRCSRYVATSPVLLRLNASSDIPVQIAPGWQIVVLDFDTLSIRTNLLESQMRTFMAS